MRVQEAGNERRIPEEKDKMAQKEEVWKEELEERRNKSL